tara:strand:+ start:249 stop:431 length:183 start_codon:yes stop_codon:yes gene_type:complete
MPKQIENMMISKAVSDGNFYFLEKYVKNIQPYLVKIWVITNPKNGENILSTSPDLGLGWG